MNQDKKSIAELIAKFINITTVSLIQSSTGTPTEQMLAQFVGATIEKLILTVGTDISARNLSPRERNRIGISIIQIIEKSIENLNSGKYIRNDNFFEDGDQDGKTADELLESLLKNIQTEYEEKKVKYISWMFANFLFDDTIDKQFCNTYLRIASDLTYRQFCYIYLICNKEKFGLNKNIDFLKDPYRTLRGDQILELHELRNLAIIYFPEIFLHLDPKQGAQMFPLEQADILPFGKYLFEYLDLGKIDISDVEKLCGRKVKS